ncbi:MAG: hypothetical protein CYPHOPRED_005573 [Cyphobasidiales sp. Tagirdzhanova-0007]|nr:MAG: hypothetical protein CYPHOPRED_005573 [Cyphobasidiales sp. Tagirdzhanova-0007]
MPCEWAEEYRPGGFHPVTLGDIFKDGRYRIIRKLGYGSYSTVWLVRDALQSRYAALKIMMAKDSDVKTELDILGHLSARAEGDADSYHLTTLFDTFMCQGPNGSHRCLVFEPMGSTVASMAERLPENIPQRYGVPARYPISMARRILLHTLRGLAFLHKNGITHGDLQPGNILFSIDNIHSISEDDLKQNESHIIPLRRVDGKVDRWAPKTLYLEEPLFTHAQSGSGSMQFGRRSLRLSSFRLGLRTE